MEQPNPDNSVAVIGSGMAGVICARLLSRAGWRVRVFDKSGAIGGRLATRRRPGGPWNHGAARVQARTPEFARLLRSLCEAGAAEEIALAGERFAVRGRPDMRSLLEPLAANLDLQLSAEVYALRGGPGAWRLELTDGREFGTYGTVVLAIPAPQAQRLLERSGIGLSDVLAPVSMAPRWTLLLGFSRTTGPAGVIPAGPVLASVSRHRPAASGTGPSDFAETWVARATGDWSRTHLELSREEAAGQLCQAVASLGANPPDYAVAHRWRYALTERPLGRSHVWLAERRIGLCGDWCVGDRAEHAYLSGTALANCIGQSPIV